MFWRDDPMGQAFFFSGILSIAYGCFVELYGGIIALKYSLYINETKHTKKITFLVGFEYTICIFDL